MGGKMNFRALMTGLAVAVQLLTGCGKSTNLSSQIDLIADTEQIIKVSNGQFKFTEGPVWDGDDNVYFTDLKTDEIHRFFIPDRSLHSVAVYPGQVNGLKISSTGELWGAVQQAGCIERITKDGRRVWTVAGEYQGRPFNQPNDLVLDEQGGAYFTDPSWNPPDKRNQPVKGVYYVNAAGKVTLLIDDLDKPNGILIAHGGKYLYVVDMGTDAFLRFPILSPGQLGEREVFAQLQNRNNKSAQPDGLAADEQGNIFVATETGVQVFSKTGNFINEILVPERPSNLAFFGEARDQLFITAETNVYTVKMRYPGEIYPALSSDSH